MTHPPTQPSLLPQPTGPASPTRSAASDGDIQPPPVPPLPEPPDAPSGSSDFADTSDPLDTLDPPDWGPDGMSDPDSWDPWDIPDPPVPPDPPDQAGQFGVPPAPPPPAAPPPAPPPVDPPPTAPPGADPNDSGLGRLLSDPARWYHAVTSWWAAALVVYGPALALTACAVTLAMTVLSWWTRLRRRRRFADGARWVTITPPAEVDPAGAERLWSTLHALARPRLTRLLKGQPHVVFEIHATAGQLLFGFWVPGTITPGRIEHAVRAAWPGAQAKAAKKVLPAPIPPAPAGRRLVIAAGRLTLARHEALPLRTDHKLDPLRAVLAPLQALHDHETGCVQVLARPVNGGRRVLSLRRAAHRLATRPSVAARDGLAGSSPWAHLAHTLLLQPLLAIVRELLDFITPTRLSTNSHSDHRAARDELHARRDENLALLNSPYHRDLVRAAGTKTTAAVRLWAVQTRYVTTAHVPDSITDAGHRRAQQAARGRAGTLAAALAGVLAGHNHLHRRPLRRTRQLAALQHRWIGRAQLWSTAELVALAHLPLDPHVPGLARTGAATIPPPPHIPTGTTRPTTNPPTQTTSPTTKSGSPDAVGNDPNPHTDPPQPDPANRGDTTDHHAHQAAVVLGDANTGPHRPIALPIADRRRHLCLLGANGTGKSTCICQQVLADAHARRAAILIDPKTDTVADIQHRLPDHAAERLVLLDPDAPGPAPVLNLLDPHDPVAVDNLTAILAHIYRRSWGDRIAEAFRIGALTTISRYHHLAHHNPHKPPRLPHLGDVMDLFTRESTRHLATEHLATSDDPIDRTLAGYWDSYELRTPAGREEISDKMVSKLRGLLLRRFTRDVLCGNGPTLDMAHQLDHGGLVLARLPEGVLGADTTRLLGSLLVAKAWQAVTARARQAEHERQPAALYLEEAHMFLTMHTPIETMLAQARAYNLAVILALQNLAQTASRELREAISTNVLHKMFYRLGVEDADYAQRHTQPHLTAYDLAHLDDYTAVVRMHPGGKDTPAFTLRTRPLPPINRTAA